MQRSLLPLATCILIATLGNGMHAQEVNLPGFTVSSESGLSVSEAVERESKPVEVKAEVSQTNKKTKLKKFVASYGSFNGSIFFTDRQIEQMKKVLFLSERFTEDENQKVETNDASKSEDGLDEFPIAIPQSEEQPKEIATPDIYPIFAVSSIIHRENEDWVLWLNGKRVTSDTVPEELQVSQVNGNGVKFLWSPQEAASFLFHYESIKENEPTKGLKKVLSKNSKVEQVGVDQWEFTLKPNQTFDSRYMAVLEGKNPHVDGMRPEKIVKKIEGPSAEEILRQAGFDDPSFEGGRQSSENSGRRANSLEDNIRDTLDVLQKNDRRLQGLKGRRGGGKPSGLRTDADLPSDKKASSPPVEEVAEPSTQERLQQALPAFLESIGMTPQKEENNTSNEGLPILPN